MENVLRASSAVSFRVLDISRELTHADRLFQSDDLNFTVIFKQPVFATDDNPFMEAEAREARALANGAQMNGSATKCAAPARPIMTAIFVPRVREEPEIGGYGIFMNQDNYGELMRTYCGIDIDDSHVYGRDLELLRILSDTPSLDPFLLKTSFQDGGLTVNDKYLNVVDEEVMEVRQVIEKKVRPIIAQAYGELDKSASAHQTQSFIDSIWDPQSNDAQQFISAFKIEADAVPEIFGAWKGVAYYQYQFERITERVMQVLTWLKGDASIAIDAPKLIAEDRESLMMFRKQVATLLRATYSNSRAVFDECDRSYSALVDDGNPIEFRDFLLTAVHKYWTLGACNTALVMVTDIWHRASRGGSVERFEASTLRTMFGGMKAAMDCESNGSGAMG